MAKYFVRAIGADFDAGDDGHEYGGSDEAKHAAVKAGMAIATDEIHGGKNSSIVEVQLIDGHDVVARYVVAVSVETLQSI